MRVLSIDSSTECASCALIQEDKLLGEINFNYKKQHSVILMPMIDSLLNNLGFNINDIDGFVVGKGPGSFTGLRIGIAAVKGLSQGTGKPFVGVSSLDALANNMAYTPGIICPIIDALRGNVYTSLYSYSNTELSSLSDYMVISVDDLIQQLKEFKQPVTFLGDACYIYKETLLKNIPDAKFAPLHLNLARASSLGYIGIKLLYSGYSDDLLTFSPLYLRKSQAEREYEKKLEYNAHE